MRHQRFEGKQLRSVLAGMITDTKVCSRLCSQLKGRGFKEEFASVIYKWCKDHIERYGEAPGKIIQLSFDRWAEKARDDKVVSQVEGILDYALGEYDPAENGHADLILDQASSYLSRKEIVKLKEDIEDDIEAGDFEAAFNRIRSVSQVNFNGNDIVRPIDDHEVWFDVLTEERERPLFEYPGALGQLIGPSFVPGTLFSFMGVEKAGKSYYLLDAAFRTLKNRFKVAYFEVGDLGQQETIERFGQRVLHSPVEESYVNWPVGWSKEDPDVPTTKRKRCNGVSIAHVKKKLLRYTRGRPDLLRLSCHPNSSVSVSDLQTILKEWFLDSGWAPDLIVIDYADILAPPSGYHDTKDQIDETWKQLRRLSQEMNCCVLTGTQTGSQAYRKKGTVLTRSDFSGRKTKLAHVNGMIGLNATAEDKKHDVTRINWVVRRKGGGSELTQVLVAGCFAAGMPIVLSKYASYAKQQLTVEDEKDEE